MRRRHRRARRRNPRKGASLSLAWIGAGAVAVYLWYQSTQNNANMGGQNFGVQPGQTNW